MGRKANLSNEEKAQIDGLRTKKFSIRDIVDTMARGKIAVGCYIKGGGVQKVNRKTGPKPTISPRAARVLAKSLREGGKTARMVLNESGVGVSLRTVQRVLQNHAYLGFGHLKIRPLLSAENIKKRRDWARHFNFVEPSYWRQVLFTDEKRFCFDGPVGQACFCGDSRLPREIFSRRAKGGCNFLEREDPFGGSEWNSERRGVCQYAIRVSFAL